VAREIISVWPDVATPWMPQIRMWVSMHATAI
jgi:hypothetical protein